MQIEVRHLRLVLTVKELGNLRQAAAAMQMSQHALTSQLGRIELAIGGALFDRDGETLRATRLGGFFTAGAQDVLADFDTLRRRSTELTTATDSPELRLVAEAGIGLEELVDSGKEALPDFSIAILNPPADSVLACVEGDEADIAMVVRYQGLGSRPPADVTSRSIIEREPAFIALTTGHRLANRTELDLELLADEDWIIGSPHDRSGRYESIRQVCRERGFEPRVRHSVSDWSAMVHLIRAGLGIGVVSPFAPPNDGLVYLPLVDSPLHRDLALCWRTDSPLAEAGERMWRNLVTSYFHNLHEVSGYRDWWTRHRGAIEPDSPGLGGRIHL